MTEPTPAHGDASIPDVVLDELRSAFSGSSSDDRDDRDDRADQDASATGSSATSRRGSKPPKASKSPKTSKSPKDSKQPKASKQPKGSKRPKPGRAPLVATSSTAGRAVPSPPALDDEVLAATAVVARRSRADRRRARKLARSAGGGRPDLDDAVERVRVMPATEPLLGTTVGALDSTSATSATTTGRRAQRNADAKRKAAASPASARSTIMIGGDDLPDAVYLDPDAEPRLKELYGGDTDGGSGSIVLGNELDSSGAFDAVSPPSRSMDPRVRARRIAVKRAAGRKRLIWAGVVALVLLVIVGTLAVFASSLFAVRADDVDITGAVYSDPAEVQAIVDDAIGEPVLLVDTRAIEDQLEALPWIERAAVKTDFPHHLSIDVRERLPLATFVGTDGRYRVIDRDGRVLAVLDNKPVAYMLLTGDGPDVDAGARAGRPFANAAQLVSALPTEIRSITQSVSVDATTGDLGMLLDPDLPVRLGDFADIDTKLARMLQYMRGEGGLSGCVRIDVSTGEVSCATK